LIKKLKNNARTPKAKMPVAGGNTGSSAVLPSLAAILGPKTKDKSRAKIKGRKS